MKIVITKIPAVLFPEILTIHIDTVNESGGLSYLGKLTDDIETITEFILTLTLGCRAVGTDIEVKEWTLQPSS